MVSVAARVEGVRRRRRRRRPSESVVVSLFRAAWLIFVEPRLH
jgi:hypothetical protein